MRYGIDSSYDADSFSSDIGRNCFGSRFAFFLPAISVNGIMYLMRRIQKNNRFIVSKSFFDCSFDAFDKLFLYFFVRSFAWY